MNELNILKNFDERKYYSEPFPYFVIEKCFPDKIYQQLFKDYEIIRNYLNKNYNFKDLNNTRLQINSENFLEENIFKNTIWYDFIKYHTSKKFLLDLVSIFKDDLKNYYPHIYNAFYEFNNDKNFLKIRGRDNDKYKFVIDCQPGINTPTLKKSNVRGPHVDNPVEIFGGLFYLRDNNDNSKGGDLDLYDTEKNKIYFKDKAEVKNINKLKKFKIYKYDKNQCIFFLNTIKTIHGVSERSETNFTRNLTNFVIETYFYEKLFNLKRSGIKNFIKNFLKKYNF